MLTMFGGRHSRLGSDTVIPVAIPKVITNVRGFVWQFLSEELVLSWVSVLSGWCMLLPFLLNSPRNAVCTLVSESSDS